MTQKKEYHIDIYETGLNNKLRFALGKKGKRVLVGLGLNPSTADDSKPDMTISKIMGFAQRHGFDGFLMLNLYPIRKTYPEDLPKRINSAHHQQNLESIKRLLSDFEEVSILAAWGNPISIRKYLRRSLKDIHEMLEAQNIAWLQVGTLTKEGHPRHPSRVAYALGLQKFEVEQYLARTQ